MCILFCPNPISRQRGRRRKSCCDKPCCGPFDEEDKEECKDYAFFISLAIGGLWLIYIYQQGYFRSDLTCPV